ncbi:preprotein translocase subunit SecG [Candidatus Cyanaurora vandensis]|uniref:preprotein translocase subunit SecG n=1 Tax=Candidatus Cyanaurora vandensis TaxID=2714958 RepID=UPI00257C8594|nr:preprotein translocase subunit SecG [Candidatus Cyanaurora vandensis]
MAVLVIVLKILWSLSAAGIIVSVLLHSAKGDGVAAIGGQAQLFSSQKSAEKNLDRFSWGAVAIFLILSAVLSSNILTKLPGA